MYTRNASTRFIQRVKKRKESERKINRFVPFDISAGKILERYFPC